MNDKPPLDQSIEWFSTQTPLVAIGAALGMFLVLSLLAGAVIFINALEPGGDKDLSNGGNIHKRPVAAAVAGRILRVVAQMIFWGGIAVLAFVTILAPIFLFRAFNFPWLLASLLGVAVGVAVVLGIGMFVDGLPVRGKR